MRIRFSVVLLGVLGLAAAVGAAMLTASIQAKPLREARKLVVPDANVMVAAKDMPALTVLEADCVEQRTMAGRQAPEGYISLKEQAMGKMLTLPVVAGQVLTGNLFAREGTGFHLAGLLSAGMRAVTVSLSDYSGLEGLLYPGCRVDVLGTFEITGQNKAGSAVSTALLENVEVLAVGRQAVGGEEDDKQATPPGKFNKKILVTLKVDANQAEALQLGMEHGEISLAMRNPHDDLKGDQDATLLSEGRLAQLARLMDPTVAVTQNGGEQATNPEADKTASAEKPTEEPAAPPAPAQPARSHRETPEVKINVIRGIATETLSFPYPQSMR